MKSQLYLVNLSDGQVQNTFDNADQLVKFLREKDEAGSLMGEAAFALFFGQHISTRPYWKSAFEKAKS